MWEFLKKKHRGEVVEVHPLDGPTSKGGASMNVYIHRDGSIITEEYDWFGKSIARYEGEPREVPEHVRMPDPPPRPGGPHVCPPPERMPVPAPTPRAPLEPARAQQP